MAADSIYLDHNATAPMLPAVADAVREASLRYAGNPASQHDAGRQARRALEAARQRIGEILGARTTGLDADRVIFTSGGTESNNLALHGLLGAGPQRRLITSAIEHPSVARTADRLAALGVGVDRIGVTPHGVIRLDEFEQRLASEPGEPPTLFPRNRGVLASLMLANNETGVLQPIAEAAVLCRRHSVLLHTDATQAVGKIAVSFRELQVDALTAAAHKFHGPVGIGVLILAHGVELQPILQGGFQQGSLRPGTESAPLAIGMETALELWRLEAHERCQRMTALRDQFEREIVAGFPAAVVIGGEAPRLPHTSNIAFVGLDRQALVMALDLAGVACSTGSACASGSSEASPTLQAMGAPAAVVSSSIRFSLGAATAAADIQEAAGRILSVCNRLRREN